MLFLAIIAAAPIEERKQKQRVEKHLFRFFFRSRTFPLSPLPSCLLLSVLSAATAADIWTL